MLSDVRASVCGFVPRLLLAGVALLALARSSSAQRSGLSMIVVAPNHVLLEDGLHGTNASLAWPRSGGRTSKFLTIERVGGVSRRTGDTCVGLVPPEALCPQEPLRDDTRFTTASVGISRRALAWRRMVLDVTGGLRAGWVQTNTHGQVTGETLSAGKAMWGAEIGIDAAWAPLPRLPIAIAAGVATGGLIPLSPVQYTDGYEPFGAIGLTRLRFGVVWWSRKSARAG